jgi:hypothetical protein
MTFTLPFPAEFSGDYPPLVMPCAGGAPIVRTIPSGATQEAIDAIVEGMFETCGQQQADATCETITGNNQVTHAVTCSGDDTITFTGTLPPWITIDEDTNTVIGAAGTFTAQTTAEATANAQAALDAFVTSSIANGSLVCEPPVPPIPPIVLIPAETTGWAPDAVAFTQVAGVIYGIGGTEFNSSTDGLNWSNVGTFGAGNPGDLAFGAGIFVTTELATVRVWSSPDGVTWTSHVLFGRTCQAVAFGNGIFVEAGGLGGDGGWSANGTVWNLMNTGMTKPRDITFGLGLFVAVGDGEEISTSPDGVAWTPRHSGGNTLLSVAFTNGMFVAGGNNSTIVTSPDGINWTAIAAGTVNPTEDFEAVGGDETGTLVGITVGAGTDGRVYTSSDGGATWTLFETEPANRFVSSTGIYFASLTGQVLCGFYV